MTAVLPRRLTASGQSLSVVDAQVHVWDGGADRWPEAGRAYAASPPTLSSAARPGFDGEQLIAALDTDDVATAIVVPPVFAGDDNTMALAVAHRYPGRAFVMGRVGLADPGNADRLPGWLRDPSMVGIRLTFFWEQHRRWLVDGTADWFWPLAAEYGIPVSILAPGQTPAIGAVAREHPGLRITVDHFNLSLERKDADALRDVDDLIALAPLPNVAVKASTLPSYVTQPYPFPSLYEPIRRVVAAFGPNRVFWGSELTRLPCTYREAITHFTDHLDFLDPDALALVMGDGIRSWLGLPGGTVADH